MTHRGPFQPLLFCDSVRQQTALWDGSGRQIGPSVPLRRESPMTITLLFFLAEAVVIRGAD